jgi:murein DD-endopeptidase MepM/ murein hydrolase activator NlpD
MAEEFYTLIVVPHARARFRKLRVSVRLLRRAAWAGGTLAVAVLAVLTHYTWIRVEASELKRLRAENSALVSKTAEYEASAARLQARVEQLQSTVAKLGVMAGLEQTLPDARVGGVGGVPGTETRAPSLEREAFAAMDRTLRDLGARSEKLASFYAGQKVLLASTPSIWPVRGYLSAAFGNRQDPFTGQPDFHPGIDISTPSGTPVVAPADGVVLTTAPKGAYGNAVIIDHGFGTVTRYGHLSGFAVRPGQRVRRGDTLGYVGMTGRATAPHLHYEVWVQDQTRNPIHYILDEYRTFG